MFQCAAPSTSLSQLKEREENLTTRVLAVEEGSRNFKSANQIRGEALRCLSSVSVLVQLWLVMSPHGWRHCRLGYKQIESNIATTLDWSVNIFNRARIDVLRAEILVRQLLADRSKTASGGD